MEESILGMHPCTPHILLEPFSDCLELHHIEWNIPERFVEPFTVQDRSPFVRNSLRFRYYKICANMFSWY